MSDRHGLKSALGLWILIGLAATVVEADSGKHKSRGRGHDDDSRVESRHRDDDDDDRRWQNQRDWNRHDRRPVNQPVIIRQQPRFVPQGNRINSDFRLINGTTYVPLRAPFEQMGCNVGWDPRQQQAQILYGPRTVIVTTGSSVVYVIENGQQQPVNWGVQPINVGGQIYVPLRPVASGLGLQVSWDNGFVNLGNGFFLGLR